MRKDTLCENQGGPQESSTGNRGWDAAPVADRLDGTRTEPGELCDAPARQPTEQRHDLGPRILARVLVGGAHVGDIVDQTVINVFVSIRFLANVHRTPSTDGAPR